MIPYLATAAFFRILNGPSHLVFKKITLKKLAVEMDQGKVAVQ